MLGKFALPLTLCCHHPVAAALVLSPMLMLQYQSAVVRVPQHVRLLCRKLRRVEQQLQQRQQGKPPSLEQVAAAAGVSAKLAQRALDTTGGALQVRGVQR